MSKTNIIHAAAAIAIGFTVGYCAPVHADIDSDAAARWEKTERRLEEDRRDAERNYAANRRQEESDRRAQARLEDDRAYRELQRELRRQENSWRR